MPSHRVKLIAAFAVLYVVWGSTYLAVRIGLQADLPPALFAGLRLTPAGLILLGVARLRGVRIRIPLAQYLTVATVGVFLLVGGMYGMFLAEQYIPSSLAALIVALVPLWVATAESLLPGMDRPSALGHAGLAIGFAGLGILMVPRLTGLQGSSKELLGIGLQLLSTWFWTAGTIIAKRRPVAIDAVVVTGYQMLTAGGILLCIGAALGEIPRLAFDKTGAAALLYLIVLGSCVAFTAFVWLLRHAPASKVMTYAYVNPVIAVVLGRLVLNEPLDRWVVAGMIVIVAGVALTTSAPTRSGRALPAEPAET
jgi:drug/metabolite transporter (DMT)-like permease